MIREDRSQDRASPGKARRARAAEKERHGTIRHPERMFGLNKEVFDQTRGRRKNKTVNGEDMDDDIESKGGY